MLSCESHVTSVGRSNMPTRSDRMALGFGNLLTAFEEFARGSRSPPAFGQTAFGHGIRVELDEHSGTLVNHPHVVVLIDADGVRE